MRSRSVSQAGCHSRGDEMTGVYKERACARAIFTRHTVRDRTRGLASRPATMNSGRTPARCRAWSQTTPAMPRRSASVIPCPPTPEGSGAVGAAPPGRARPDRDPESRASSNAICGCRGIAQIDGTGSRAPISALNVSSTVSVGSSQESRAGRWDYDDGLAELERRRRWCRGRLHARRQAPGRPEVRPECLFGAAREAL
jgi:hypothetical protein